MNSKDSNRTFIILMSSITSILIGLIVIGFVVFSLSGKEVVEEEENGADIILNYSSNISGLQIRNASKTKDENGMISLNDGGYFDFSVEVLLDNASKVEYEIAAVKDEANSTIADEDIRIYLEKLKDGAYTKVFGPDKFTPLKKDNKYGGKKGTMPLIQVKKTNSNTDNYRLRMWLSDKASTNNGNYSVEIEVYGIAK